jgi:hypothetical protein
MKTNTLSTMLRSSLLFAAAVSLACATNAGAEQNAQTMPAPMGAQAAPAQGQMPAQPASICGNQPFCYETPDFVATVTDFRTSTWGAYRIIDVTLRFQNETSNQLILGYTAGSGTALDDRGLRYAVGGGNALRGMGVVSGQSFDPKFALRPGGYGDARFELLSGGAQVYGLTFELDITVNEINTLEGNQHTLGGEFPLQFQGLTNGVKGTAPGLPAGGAGMMASGGAGTMAGGAAPACDPASTATALASATNSTAAQNAAATANTTVSSATAALSSLGSIFGKKKQPAAAPAQGATSAGVPCVPGANGAAGSVSNAAGPAAGGVPQSKSGASSVGAIASGVAGAAKPASGTSAAPGAGGAGAPAGVTPARAGAATSTKVAAGTATAAAPAASSAKAQAQLVKPAAKKGSAPTPAAKKPADNPDAQKAPQQPQQH